MKCMNCGAEIPEGKLRCERCGREVQIVPDYNPLDDVLTAQVKDELMRHTQAMDESQMDSIRRSIRRGTSSDRTVRIPPEEVKRRVSANTGVGRKISRNTGTGRRTSGNSKNIRRDLDEEKERRRQQARRRQQIKKKKRKRMLVILGMLAIIVIIAIILYQFSYNGQVGKGNKAFASSDYTKAEEYYNRAISKNEDRPEAYTGLSKIYIVQNKVQDAENLFLDAIKKYPAETALYKACIDFYFDTEQRQKISELLDECKKENVVTDLKDYVSQKPSFSLKEEKFDDVQELSMTGKGKEIHYTSDGSQPTMNSTKYTKPIQIKEGETTVRAISVNKKGVPSLETSKTYTVEIPIEDAPAVSPSTGQYSQAQNIEIIVPDGYTAYYTTDGTNPTTASKKYTKAITMPQGNTLFCAVLVNSKGKMSGITKRNYELSFE